VIAAEFEAERVSLMRYDGSTATLQIVAAHGLDPEVVRTTRVRLGEGISGRVVAEGKPLVVADVAADPRVGRPPKPGLGDTFMSMPLTLSVPIVTPQDILGVINVTNRASGPAFDEDDTAFVSALAGQAVAVMERAMSLERLRQAHVSLQEVQSDLATVSRLAHLGEVAEGLAGKFRLYPARSRARNRIDGVQRSDRGGDAGTARQRRPELTVHGANSLSDQEIVPQRSLRERRDLAGRRRSLESDWRRPVRAAEDLARCRIECLLRGTGLVRGGRQAIARIAMQLIRNSAEAMPAGGTITVSTENRDGALLLSVADDGPGISPEHRARLFEPFFTTRSGHQGLGLSIVHGLAQRMGAVLGVRSEVGAGTLITVTFPGAGASCPPQEVMGAVGGETATTGAGILLVDPSLHRLSLYQRFLERDGHQVTGVTSGDQGLMAAEVERFDLVIADLTMPDVSGRDLARSVHATAPGVPFIFIGDWESRTHAFGTLDSGPASKLTRPVTRRQLNLEVRRLLKAAADGSLGAADWIR
jgi:signal transduction histidine kinase